MATKEYRYVQTKNKRELQFNIHVKEMIEMLKNERVKKNLYVKGVKLTKHAIKRMKQRFDVSNPATATKMVKEMLSKAQRIGEVMSYDGRINVLYAYNKTAIFLSPDLKYVVTVDKHSEVTYKPLARKLREENLTKEEILNLHIEHLRKLEEIEREQMERVLKVEEKVREANQQYGLILDIGRGGKGRKGKIREMISEHNLSLKQEGWKLFDIKLKKRHICKSLVALS